MARLDLAFNLADGLDAALLQDADGLANRTGAESLWTAVFQTWLADLQSDLPVEIRRTAYSLGLELLGDDAIAELNQTWRDHSGPTDVLSFAALDDSAPMPLSNPDGDSPDEPLELGDIVVSLETAQRQCQEAGHPLKRELLFLASHGLLHLLGWDHPDEPSLAAMLQRQEQLIQAAATALARG